MNCCVYFPWKVYEENNTKYFSNYINNDDNLAKNMETIENFIRDSEQMDLYSLDNEIKLIVIPQKAYRPQKILSVISDVEHGQCFVAASLDWIDINGKIEDSLKKISSIYNANQYRINMIVNRSFNKILSKQNEKSIQNE